MEVKGIPINHRRLKTSTIASRDNQSPSDCCAHRHQAEFGSDPRWLEPFSCWRLLFPAPTLASQINSPMLSTLYDNLLFWNRCRSIVNSTSKPLFPWNWIYLLRAKEHQSTGFAVKRQGRPALPENPVDGRSPGSATRLLTS